MPLALPRRAAAAAALSLRWHAGTGGLVVLTTLLTLAGALPALLLLGADPLPLLASQGVEGARLLTDWGPRGVPFTRFEAVAMTQLRTLVQGAVLLLVLVGVVTLLAVHATRATRRAEEVIVARSVGASRRLTLHALALEAAALASMALLLAMVVTLLVHGVAKAAWPGTLATAPTWPVLAVALGVSAVTLLSPALLVRAVRATRLVDADRRPLTLLVPALQLGAALVVLAGAVTLDRAMGQDARRVAALGGGAVRTQAVDSREPDRLRRAQGIAAFLDRWHATAPGQPVSIASRGMHQGLGTSAAVIAECGECVVGTMLARTKSALAVHHAVSGDTFSVAGLRLVAGRALTDADRWGRELVVVVNQRAARDLFQDGDAVGRRIKLGMLGSMWFRVVGVVADAPPVGLAGALQPPHAVYLSILQQPAGLMEVATAGAGALTLPVDALGAPRGAARLLTEAWAVEAAAVSWVRRLLQYLGVLAMLVAVGGVVTLLLLWLDSQRDELGVRRAVGARHRHLYALVLSRAALVCVAGTAFGSWLGLVAWDVVPRVLPGAPSWDGGAVLQAGAMLSGVVLLLATAVAWRVARTPVSALLRSSE